MLLFWKSRDFLTWEWLGKQRYGLCSWPARWRTDSPTARTPQQELSWKQTLPSASETSRLKLQDAISTCRTAAWSRWWPCLQGPGKTCGRWGSCGLPCRGGRPSRTASWHSGAAPLWCLGGRSLPCGAPKTPRLTHRLIFTLFCTVGLCSASLVWIVLFIFVE